MRIIICESESDRRHIDDMSTLKLISTVIYNKRYHLNFFKIFLKMMINMINEK